VTVSGPAIEDVSAVAGRSAFDIPGAAEATTRAVPNIGREGVAATVISAVDVALWDLKARLLGLLVASLLGRARPPLRKRRRHGRPGLGQEFKAADAEQYRRT
jgi:L-alanine-DL-glutamate epimerase-like enolase superfamily enzyme